MIINGWSQGFFKSSRGLCQGDPISPALFIVGIEVLSGSLNALLEVWGFAPFKVFGGCPIISHLTYADYVTIFNSTPWSGQQVNFHKSCFLVH